MPSGTPLSVFYESLDPRTATADSLNGSVDEKSEPKYESISSVTANNPSAVNLIRKPSLNESNNGTVVQRDKSCNSIGPLKCTSNFNISLFPSKIDMETVKEVFVTIGLTLWGLIAAMVISLIPRRFRYKNIEGQVVLITGAGSGIGRLMAKKLALKHGATIVVWDINQQGADETVKDIKAAGGKCYGYVVDVSKKEKIFEAAEKVKNEVGKVDILINNAGIVSGSRFLETPDIQVERTFQVNSLANFWTCKSFLPSMVKEDHGHIVTIASTAGLVGVNRLVDYCASKYAAVGFHEALATELRGELGLSGINTTLVCPYYINTGMFDGVKSKLISILDPEDVVNDVIAGILTNQEMIIIPRYVLYLIVAKYFVPGNVGMKLQEVLGITGTMLGFKGRPGNAKNGVAAK